VNNVHDIPKLHLRPAPQIAWHLQIKERVARSKRQIDKMSIAEIAKMYKDGNLLCDTCGKSLGKFDFMLEDHIIHLINPSFVWSCEDCIINDIKNDRIIAETPDKLSWQRDYI
jgi:hypothetical protein